MKEKIICRNAGHDATNDAVVFVRSFRFTCACIARAKQLHYAYVGIEFYGECWAGMSKDYDIHLPSKKCKMIEEHGCGFEDCNEELKGPRKCVGGALSLYVYKVNGKGKEF